MHNLLRFIKLNQFLLLFILIEALSITLLLQNNSYQANKIVKFSTQYTSNIYNYTSSFTDYLGLKETNDYLIAENAKLHTLSQNNERLIDSTLLQNKKFNYIAAKVINNSVKKRNNFITLNKGSKNGIKHGMGVITNEGVIGIVYSVSQDYALVISLLHSRSATGIFLKKNMHTGILTWKGFNYRTAIINDLPAHIPLNIGDTIITNSYSNIYPEGINIGTISDFKKNDDDGFYTINVSLFEDFNNLRYVYVIHSTQSEEQLLLEEIMKQDE
jgi:rod shape-determining protein MreC